MLHALSETAARARESESGDESKKAPDLRPLDGLPPEQALYRHVILGREPRVFRGAAASFGIDATWRNASLLIERFGDSVVPVQRLARRGKGEGESEGSAPRHENTTLAGVFQPRGRGVGMLVDRHALLRRGAARAATAVGSQLGSLLDSTAGGRLPVGTASLRDARMTLFVPAPASQARGATRVRSRARTGLRCDPVDQFLVQAAGRSDIRVARPQDAIELRARKGADGSYSSEDDPFDRSAARGGADVQFGSAVLEPGQALYLPARTWYALEPSASDGRNTSGTGAHNLRVAFAYDSFSASSAIWEVVFGAIARERQQLQDEARGGAGGEGEGVDAGGARGARYYWESVRQRSRPGGSQ